MRRLWAYILIAFTALVTVFALGPSFAKKITSNAEFERRRQFTFQLTQKETDDPAKLDSYSASKMAKTMEARLLASGITSYNISTSGNSESSDIVTVDFHTDSDNYEDIVTYLTFDGSFALMNKKNTVVPEADFRAGDAYIKEAAVNEYPTVILPVSTASSLWESLIDDAAETDEDGNETKNIYLIYNYIDGENYQTLNEQNKWNEKDRIFLTFDYSKNFDATNSYFYYQQGYIDSNGNGVADANEVKAAFNKANYLLNLFNASELDYEVTCIKGLTSETTVWLDASVEKIYSAGKLVWNATLTALVAGIVITTLLLAVFYRLGALSSLTASLLTVFLSFVFMVNAGMEYGVIAIAALVAVGIISLVSNIIYLNKLKEDAYRGHTLKKANTEASKKSLLPIIDINLVGVVVGVMCYLLAGTAFRAFGAILGIGSLISLIINTLGFKGLMWLATNTTKLSGKYEAFGINSANVPNHMAEEKQRFFGAYADKDFTKKKKPVGILAGGLFVLAIVGVLVGASLKGGITKSEASKTSKSQIYVTNRYDDSKKSTDDVLNSNTLKSDVLDKIMVYSGVDEENKDVYKPLTDYVNIFDDEGNVTNYDNFTVSDSVTEEGTGTVYYTTNYYVVDLKGSSGISLSTKAYFLPYSAETAEDLSTVLKHFAEENPFDLSIKTTVTYVPASTIEWGKVVLASSISVLILTVYLMIRYRLSRGLTSIVFPVLSGAITLGILMLLNILGLSIPLTVMAALPIVVILSYAFMISLMNREREMVIDDKSRDITLEHRQELSVKATGVALTQIFACAVIGVYLLINFFGFGLAVSSYTYLIAIIGSLVALGFIIVLFMPIANFFYGLFGKINFDFKPRKKNKKTVVKKSAEPEEAVFIGIND